MPEVGRRIGIHVSRVFQLRNRALERIGERLRVQGIETAMEMMPAPANLATD